MSEVPKGQKTGFRGKAWGLLAAGALVVVGFFIAVPSRNPAQLTVQVNDEVELRLETILSQTNPIYKYRPWQRRVYDAFPEVIKREVLSEFWEPNHGVEISAMPPRPGIARFMFSPQKSKGAERTDAAAYQAITDVLRKHSLYMQLNYGRGWTSRPQVFQQLYSESTGKGIKFGLFGSDFDAIPVTVKEIELQFIENAFSGSRKIWQSVRIPNPVYVPINPLVDGQALPKSVTHNGVSVTLRGLFTKAVKPNELRYDLAGNNNYPNLHDGLFLQAAGTPDDPYHGCALFQLVDEGTSTTDWKIESTAFSYGTRYIPYVPNGVAHRDWDSTQGLVQCFTWFDDFGVLDQPLSASATLVRRRNFPPDEIKTVELELPTTGSYQSYKNKLSFWSGPVNIGVGNQAEFPETCFNSLEKLVIYLSKTTSLTDCVQATVTAADGTSASLNGYMVDRCFSNDDLYLGFDTFNTVQSSQHSSIDLSDFTTLTLTIISPQRMDKTFDFIATPVEAQVPAAPASPVLQ